MGSKPRAPKIITTSSDSRTLSPVFIALMILPRNGQRACHGLRFSRRPPEADSPSTIKSSLSSTFVLESYGEYLAGIPLRFTALSACTTFFDALNCERSSESFDAFSQSLRASALFFLKKVSNSFVMSSSKSFPARKSVNRDLSCEENSALCSFMLTMPTRPSFTSYAEIVCFFLAYVFSVLTMALQIESTCLPP